MPHCLFPQEADIAVGLTITMSRSEVVDFSVPYQEEQLALLSKKQGFLPKWRAIFWPFRPTLWVAILCTIPLFAAGLWVVATVACRQRDEVVSRGKTGQWVDDIKGGLSLMSCVTATLRCTLWQGEQHCSTGVSQ